MIEQKVHQAMISAGYATGRLAETARPRH